MKNSNKFVLGALLGGAIGAVAGILFAPRSGKETRKIVSKKANDLTEKGKELIKETADTISDKLDK
ncbi:MAG: YtxH domain-containing protein [Patescibacteria group bacterium]